MSEATPWLAAIYVVLASMYALCIVSFAYLASMHINRSRLRIEDLRLSPSLEDDVTRRALDAAVRDFHDAYGVVFLACIALELIAVAFPAAAGLALHRSDADWRLVLLAVPMGLHLYLITRLHREMAHDYRVECEALAIPATYTWLGGPASAGG